MLSTPDIKNTASGWGYCHVGDALIVCICHYYVKRTMLFVKCYSNDISITMNQHFCLLQEG